MRDHGGNLDAAMRRYGGPQTEWIDLSTGINPLSYPLPTIPPAAWTALPTAAEVDALARAAAAAYGCARLPLPVAGAQAAIQLIPRLTAPGDASILEPTYNEHAAALRAAGWRVGSAGTLADLAGADIAVVVNPNNPDGQRHDPAALHDLASRVGLLVVDESFADAHPELSLAGSDLENVVLLRSFGKFYGLAGLRLGFVIAAEPQLEILRSLAGPWAVSGPAIAIGCVALADTAWHEQTIARLDADARRLDNIARRAGWEVAGGSTLFRLYDTGDAAAAQHRLAQAQIWSRRFPYSDSWLRLGLPDGAARWERVEAALSG